MSTEIDVDVIHRDGGHHSSRVGDKQSCIDAEQVVLTERAENADLRAALDGCVPRSVYEAELAELRAAIDAARETK